MTGFGQCLQMEMWVCKVNHSYSALARLHGGESQNNFFYLECSNLTVEEDTLLYVEQALLR